MRSINSRVILKQLLPHCALPRSGLCEILHVACGTSVRGTKENTGNVGQYIYTLLENFTLMQTLKKSSHFTEPQGPISCLHRCTIRALPVHFLPEHSFLHAPQ
jgi:hypothetical protein